MQLVFGTGNAHKLSETRAILSWVEIIGYTEDDIRNVETMFPGGIPEIQSMDILEIVKQKAKNAYLATGKSIMVEDTGLFIDSFKGFPGPFVKYIVEWPGIGLLFKMLVGEKNRTVRAITGVALYDGENWITGYGELKGSIPEHPRGDKFGWSNAFEPLWTGKTFGEMTEDEKNDISMRKIAFLDFMENLRKRAEYSKD